MQSSSRDSVSKVQWLAVDFEADFEIPLLLSEKLSESELLNRIRPSRLFAWSKKDIEDSNAQDRFRSKAYVEVSVPSQIFVSEKKEKRLGAIRLFEDFSFEKFYITEFRIVTVDDFTDESNGRISRIGRLIGKGLLRKRSYVPGASADPRVMRAEYPDSNSEQIPIDGEFPQGIPGSEIFEIDTSDPERRPARSLSDHTGNKTIDRSDRTASLHEFDNNNQSKEKVNKIAPESLSTSVQGATSQDQISDPEQPKLNAEAVAATPKGKQTQCLFCRWFFLAITFAVIYFELGLLSALTYVFTQLVVCRYRLITQSESKRSFFSNALGLCWVLLFVSAIELGNASFCLIQSKEVLVGAVVILTIATAIFAKDRLFCAIQPVLVFLILSAISNSPFLCSAITAPWSHESPNPTEAAERTSHIDSKPAAPESKRESAFGNLASYFRDRFSATDDLSERELARMQRLTGDTTYPLHVLSELEGWFPNHRLCTDKSQDAELIYLGSAAAFNRNSADLSDSAKTTVRRVGRLLQKVEFSQLLVIGHADNLGNSLYNYELSEKRAQAFFDALIKETVLPASKIRTLGRGDTSPIFSSSTTLSSYNRRVELLVICKEKK